MRVGELNCLGGLRILFGEELLAPKRVGAAAGRVGVYGSAGRTGAAAKGLDRGLHMLTSDRFREIFFVDSAPVLPFLHDFFAVEEHAAKDDTRRAAAALLSVVTLQRFAEFEGQGAIELVLQIVDVILGAPLGDLVIELFIVVFDPALDAFPRVRDGRRRGKAFFEILHLDFSRGNVLKGVDVFVGRYSGKIGSHTGRVGRGGRLDQARGTGPAVDGGRSMSFLIWRVEIWA